jgi:hypothetical protein
LDEAIYITAGVQTNLFSELLGACASEEDEVDEVERISPPIVSSGGT